MIKKIIKSILFLRYLFIIFILSVIIFLITPKFFDYSKKESFIKKTLKENYSISLKNYSNISYHIFPIPNLEISGANLKFGKDTSEVNVEKLSLRLDFKQIYQIKLFNTKKILIEKGNFKVDTKNFKLFLEDINNLNHYIKVINSAIIIQDKKNKVTSIENLNFNNQNGSLIFEGKIFNKKFKSKFYNGKLNIDIPEIGFKNIVIFSNYSIDGIIGEVKSKILNNNLNFKFKKEKDFEIFNSFFVNRFIKTSFDGILKINPYFNFDVIANIQKFDLTNFIKDRNISKKIDNFSNVNKKLNGKIKIFYKSKKYNYKIIKDADITLFFENGDIIFEESILNFEGGSAIFFGNISDIDGYTKLKFNLSGKFEDVRKFLKKFKIDYKKQNNNMDLNISGSLNIISKKINFNHIKINNTITSKEDQKYYKDLFESLVNNKLSNILNYKTIREGLFEIN